MISSLKSRLIAYSSFVALAFALFALSLGFGVQRASAEDLGTGSCSLVTAALDDSVEVAEELDVLCHASAAETQSVDTVAAEVETASDADQPASPAQIVEPAEATAAESAEATAPLAIEGQAIPVDITQSVTIAVLGEDEAATETDVTGSLPSVDAPAEVKEVPDSDTQAPGPAE